MQQFQEAKQPSAVKEALKNWIAENTPNFLKAPAQPQESTPTVPAKVFFETPKFLSDFGHALLNLFNFEIEVPTIHLPKRAIETKLQGAVDVMEKPFIALHTLLTTVQKAVEKPVLSACDKLKGALETVVNAIERRIIAVEDKAREKIERAAEKVEEKLKELLEHLPKEQLHDLAVFIHDIPQQYIIPAALWMAAFIPTESIKYSLNSGINKVTRFLNGSFSLAKRGFSYLEGKAKQFSSYIYTTLFLPLYRLWDLIYRWISSWLLRLFNKIKAFARATFLSLQSIYPFLKKALWATWKWIKIAW